MNNQLTTGSALQPFDDLVSVREAAHLLRVSESTVWRWINEDLLPAHRVGRKRVYLKRGELTPLLRPARGEGGDMLEKEKRSGKATASETAQFVQAIEAAERLQAEQAKRGRPLLEAWQDINNMREERSRELE